MSSEIIERLRRVDSCNRVETKVNVVMDASIAVMLATDPTASRISKIRLDTVKERSSLVEESLDIFGYLWKGDEVVPCSASKSGHFKLRRCEARDGQRVGNIISLTLSSLTLTIVKSNPV